LEDLADELPGETTSNPIATISTKPNMTGNARFIF